ncbi:tyrosine-type recombinase/integrase [Endozoicomonadaceae bacterium StTr2]
MICQCASKKHWVQISLRYVQQLQQTRLATGLFDDVPTLQQPTFHEIRALSAHLMEKFGEDITAIQAVMGHTNPETTEIYLKEHEGRFKQVSAPLKEIKL